MIKLRLPFLIMALLMGTILINPAWTLADDEESHDDETRFEVTITNLTRAQNLTPILVASHREGVSLFKLGSPASAELETLAEEGNTGPLTALLLSNSAVSDVATSGGLLGPGKSVTVILNAARGFKYISLASMLIPTNDGFFSLNGVKAPKGNRMMTYYSPAYDAGTERNDETCASIPGPDFLECGGPGSGGAPTGGEEGFVHIHAGIHGIGDFVASERDWRNPVAKITVRRVQ